MLYDSNEKEYRILDETSISFGTAEPTGNGRKGDIYIQTSDSANGWKKLLQFIIIPTEMIGNTLSFQIIKIGIFSLTNRLLCLLY